MGTYFPCIEPTSAQELVKVIDQGKNGTKIDEILPTTMNKENSIASLIVKLGSWRLYRWIANFKLLIKSKKYSQRWRFII